MKMIATPTAVTANQYTGYVHNCQRNAACEPSFSAPLPGVPYLQLYVEFGALKPFTVEFQLVNHCTGATEQIFPSNYVVGKTPDGIWYGVFKYFNVPVSTPETFVVWLSVNVIGDDALIEKTFFSEMLVLEPCGPLTKIKSCFPEGATLTGFDVNGLYYGLPANVDFLGVGEVRYFHIAYVRQGKVRELSNKGTFKSSLYKTFRSTIERVYQVETELVPKWYKDVLLAIYARGAIQVDDGPTYLVSDLNFEAINEDDLTWKPFAQLKTTTRQFFGCDDSACFECCSPIIIEAIAISGGSESASGSGGGDCLPVSIDQSDIPNAVVGEPYFHAIGLMGTPPFALGSVTKPAWMNVAIAGSTIVLTGTPPGTSTNEPVSIEVTNCEASSDTLVTTISAGENFYLINNAAGAVVSDITPVFFLITSGGYPVNNGEQMEGHHGGGSGNINVVLSSGPGSGSVKLYINGELVDCANISGAGTYVVTAPVFNTGDLVEIIIDADSC